MELIEILKLASIALAVSVFIGTLLDSIKAKIFVMQLLKEQNKLGKKRLRGMDLRLKHRERMIARYLLKSTLSRNKLFSSFSLYVSSSLVSSIYALTTKLIKEGEEDSRSKNELTIVGIMLGNKVKTYSKNQLILCLSLISYIGISFYLDLPLNSLFVFIISFMIFLIYLDQKLLEYRIANGIYGKNKFETLELLSFIENHPDKDDFNDGNGYKKILSERQLQELIIESNEVGELKGVI